MHVEIPSKTINASGCLNYCMYCMSYLHSVEFLYYHNTFLSQKRNATYIYCTF